MPDQLINITQTSQWRTESRSPLCSEPILSWLTDTTSLTNKLEQRCTKFSVQVRKQITTNNQLSSLSNYFPYPEKVFVREVTLHCDGIATVFAQTEIPYSTLTEQQQKLMELGDNSLGRVLFQEKSLQRGEIELAEFQVGSPLHLLCHSLSQSCQHSLWARRSLFYIHNKPLLVSEVFLPASGIYA